MGTTFKKDNSVEIKTIKIELIKKNFDEKLIANNNSATFNQNSEKL